MEKPYRFSWQELGQFRQDQLGMVLELTERFGRVAHVSMLGTPVFFISEPAIIREVLVRHADQLHKDRFTTHIFKRILGIGLLSAEDEFWRQQRKLMQPIFHAAHIDEFAADFASQAREMCQQWPEGGTVQLDKEMMALTLRIICGTMFSADIENAIDALEDHFDVLLNEAQFQLKFGLRIPNWVPVPTYRRQNRSTKAIEEMLWQIIQRRKAQLAHSQGSNTDPPADLLTMLLTARYENGQSMSDGQVLNECKTIFLAGHETTAVALTWTWVELLRHPQVLARLTEEVQETLADRPVTFGDIAKMPYLTQVLKEAMRLYPPAAAVAREVMETFTVDGYVFKKGTTLVIHTHTLHRQEVFYPQPNRFEPDRFAEDTEPDRYTYMPFGAGPRTCIGNAFAMLEMQIVLATMIQHLELSLVPGQTFEPTLLVTLKPRDGVQVQVSEKNPVAI